MGAQRGDRSDSQRRGIDVAPPGEMPDGLPPGALLSAQNRPDVRLAPADLIGRAYRCRCALLPAALRRYGRPAQSTRGHTGVTPGSHRGHTFALCCSTWTLRRVAGACAAAVAA
jgi:hypothetical protein